MNPFKQNKGPPLTEEEVIDILDYMTEVGINPALKVFDRTVGEFFKYVSRRADLMNIYLSNQQTRAEVLADEVVNIADDESSIDRAKVKITARQWFSGRILHRKFGDKLSVDHNVVVDIRGAIEDARARAGKVVIAEPASQLKLDRPVVPSIGGFVSPSDADPNYNEKLDRTLAGMVSRVSVPPCMEGENPEEWADYIVSTLPIDSQVIPAPSDEEDEIDIFS